MTCILLGICFWVRTGYAIDTKWIPGESMKYLTPLLLLLFLPTVLADGQAEYKYREGVMEAIGGQMASVGAIMRGQVHKENLLIHARSIAELARIVPDIFPEDSAVRQSEALPAVWENPEEFKQKTEDFIAASDEFASAVESGEGVGQALQKLGGSCKGCHDEFREEH